jgi:1,4-alpha-glucan branching enzyme
MRTSRLVKESVKPRSETMGTTFRESNQAGVSEMECREPCQVKDGVIFSGFFLQARTVQLAGSFNNWQPAKTPMQKSGDGVWQVRLSLAKGVYKYRFVVDGRWQQDPNNKMTEPNPYGELNSVVTVS